MIVDSDFVRQKQVRDPFIVRPVVLLVFLSSDHEIMLRPSVLG